MKNSPALRADETQLDSEKREIYRYAAQADAKNTQRAYNADWKQFLLWCKRRNKAPLPADPDAIASYLRYCAETQKLKISTVRRRMSAIAEAHKRNGYESPCSEWVVRNTMKRLRRDLGEPARGKSPILVKDLKEMVLHCPEDLMGIRDKAILLIGFAGAFRRSELVSINVDDLTTSDEGLVILIREGKTDQKREGRKVAIPFGKDPLTCPIRALLNWLDEASISHGSVFVPLLSLENPDLPECLIELSLRLSKSTVSL